MKIERGFRLDLLIAVCALLISSLAMAASWLQSRETARQTDVLEQQLSAQVWPYVAVSSGIETDAFALTIRNDGLGPAVLRNLTVTVDGRPRSDFGGVVHAVLGPNVMKRRAPGEHLGVRMDALSVGSVLRPGASLELFSISSKRFAAPFGRAGARIDVRVCYCAIVPGKCWQNDTATDDPPEPAGSCSTLPDDILHENVYEVFKRL